MGVSCFLSVGRSLEDAVRRVRLAEDLGYEAAYVTHINGRESLTVVTHYAAHTERIRLGPGVVPIYTRTPATMAQTAATIHELSGERLRLGLGVSHRPVVEGWHGERMERPVAEMREYVALLRAMLARTELPSPTTRWSTNFALGDLGPYPHLPIYLAALSPGMLRAAGESADGVTLWLCNPTYIRDVVIPAVAEGREAAGKTMEGFDIVAAVPAACVEDPGPAREALRRSLLPYFGLPFYRVMIDRSGFGADLDGFDAAMAQGDGEAMVAAISDGFLEALGAIGDASVVRAGLERYAAAGTTSPALSPVAGSDVEASLRAAAPTAPLP